MATNAKNRFVDEFYEEFGFYPPDSIDNWEGAEEFDDGYEDVYSDLDGYDNYDIY